MSKSSEIIKTFISCRCHVPPVISRFLITAIINQSRNPGIFSDLTNAEFTKFKDSRTLNGDDVLDMHSFLKDFNSDFSTLFGYKKV